MKYYFNHDSLQILSNSTAALSRQVQILSDISVLIVKQYMYSVSITKFSMIGYYQPDLITNRTV